MRQTHSLAIITVMVQFAQGTVLAQRFQPVGSMEGYREYPRATLLSNGKVLVAGGGLRSTEVFDPVTNQFTTSAQMSLARHAPAAALLQNGHVLMLGGHDQRTDVERFDPATGSFSPAGNLTEPRKFATATLLGDGPVSTATLQGEGQVLVVGGLGANGEKLATVELYDPATGQSRKTRDSLTVPRSGHTAVKLADGRVAIFGGDVLIDEEIDSRIEIFDPSTETFEVTGVAVPGRVCTANDLLDGQILLTWVDERTDVTYVGMYNTPEQSIVGRVLFRRSGAAFYPEVAVRLATGEVLIPGGLLVDRFRIVSGIADAWLVDKSGSPALPGR